MFPADFRTKQRHLFRRQYQNDSESLEYIRKLQAIANAAGDITEREIVAQFWECGNQNVVAKLMSLKLDEYNVDLATVCNEVVAAEQILEKEAAALRHSKRYVAKAEKTDSKRKDQTMARKQWLKSPDNS